MSFFLRALQSYSCLLAGFVPAASVSQIKSSSFQSASPRHLSKKEVLFLGDMANHNKNMPRPPPLLPLSIAASHPPNWRTMTDAMTRK